MYADANSKVGAVKVWGSKEEMRLDKELSDSTLAHQRTRDQLERSEEKNLEQQTALAAKVAQVQLSLSTMENLLLQITDPAVKEQLVQAIGAIRVKGLGDPSAVRQYKGKHYFVIGHGQMRFGDGPDSMWEPCTFYQGSDGKLWSRSTDVFNAKYRKV